MITIIASHQSRTLGNTFLLVLIVTHAQQRWSILSLCLEKVKSEVVLIAAREHSTVTSSDGAHGSTIRRHSLPRHLPL
jgi:hypothetical protein